MLWQARERRGRSSAQAARLEVSFILSGGLERDGLVTAYARTGVTTRSVALTTASSRASRTAWCSSPVRSPLEGGVARGLGAQRRASDGSAVDGEVDTRLVELLPDDPVFDVVEMTRCPEQREETLLPR